MSCLEDSIAALSIHPSVPSGESSRPATLLTSDMANNSAAMSKAIKQPWDAFLVLDVEATCIKDSPFGSYPNEIIEWPVCLLRWKDKNSKGEARQLEVVDEFRSFVKPTWKPLLSDYCKQLTGITQEQVDRAPTFVQLMQIFPQFLLRNGLIDAETGERLVRFCWCCDGPYDIRDFVVKQCFMSEIPMPAWIQGEMLDVRLLISEWLASNVKRRHGTLKSGQKTGKASSPTKRIYLPITRQLQVLGLPPFQGREHSGIDDTRNITRIVIEAARRGMKLQPNTGINPNRRWPWMGKLGRVREGYY